MPIKKFLVLVAGFLPLVGIGQVSSDDMALKPGDPVVSTLDSLLSIRNVLRLSETDMVTKEVADPNAVVFSNDFIQSRISKISTPVPLTFNNQVKRYIELYASQRVQLTKSFRIITFIFPCF